jgi:hypothetical protein
MTPKERLKVHAEIVRQNREHFEDWQCAQYWNGLTAARVAEMLAEKDRAMEWDEQFGFLCALYDSKTQNNAVSL